jgi:uncharacterized membrane protein
VIHLMLLAVGIGFVAGLRSLTAPALVSWAAHLGGLPLRGTGLSFMSSPIAVAVFSLLAILELIGDLLPQTPSRIAPLPLGARIISGGLCGACIYAAAGNVAWTGVFWGIVGALIGSYLGYYVRGGLGNSLKIRDAFIAVPEDIAAIGLAYLIVR